MLSRLSLTQLRWCGTTIAWAYPRLASTVSLSIPTPKRTVAATSEISVASQPRPFLGWAENNQSWFTCRHWRLWHLSWSGEGPSLFSSRQLDLQPAVFDSSGQFGGTITRIALDTASYRTLENATGSPSKLTGITSSE